MMTIHTTLLPFVQAATRSGFTVHVPTASIRPGNVGFVWVTRQDEPGIALMEIPTFPNLEPIMVSVPVKPSKAYGSGIVQDHDGSVDGVLRLLRQLMNSSSVVPRFIHAHPAVPVDHRIRAATAICPEEANVA